MAEDSFVGLIVVPEKVQVHDLSHCILSKDISVQFHQRIILTQYSVCDQVIVIRNIIGILLFITVVRGLMGMFVYDQVWSILM